MNYYERHIGDYIKKTAHLSLLEHGVYTRLLDVYYDRECGIPDDKAARLVGARNEPETQALQVVLQEFFELRDGVWFNSRCDQEIGDYAEGEPEREVKKANEGNRLKRHRQERAALFKVLTDRGEHAPWNIGMDELRQRVSALQVSGPETPVATQPATAPATPATATQTPLPIHQTPEKEDSGSADAEATTKTVTLKNLMAEGVDRQKASDWLVLRKAKRLPLTVTAWEDTKAEGRKVGLDPAQTVAYAVSSNWAGFKASWYAKDNGGAVGAGSDIFAGAI
ncbi:YdaU family protein [Hydrogenophaga sp.]|uniref:YdaU family protein n=1 Tax=Hydrogenophaga sp. TaxID=1904254 RepID=UPI003F713CFD